MWFFKKNRSTVPPRAMVSIRMEAIGGQGANSAGKILAEAAVLGMKYSGNHFSSFGSEKRGSPVKSYVRFSTLGKPIRSASAIEHPDLLVIFHENLLISHPEILLGCGPDTDVLINSPQKPRDLHFPIGTRFRNIITLDAQRLANKNQCGLNAVLLGAMSHLLPEVSAEALQKTLSQFFARLPLNAQEQNQAGFASGERHLDENYYKEEQSSGGAAKASPLPRLGWRNSPLGGLITNPGNSVLKDHSASRKGSMPRLLADICFHCGFCDMVCPDYCFVWKTEPTASPTPRLQGIDYQYCKGCQKCVVACPVQALVLTPEDEIPESEKQIKLFPHLSSLPNGDSQS